MDALNELVGIKMEVGTLATLIAGLYHTFATVHPMAIPASLFIEIAVSVKPYLEKWDYEVQSFEDWVKYNLIIYPYEFFDEEDIESFKSNELFIQFQNGNVVLIATAKIESYVE